MKSCFRFWIFFKSVAILILSSCIGLLFRYLGFAEANIITVYVFGVLITSVVTRHRIYSLISSIVSVLVFNYFFTDPQFTLQAYDKGYPITFLIMFLAALLTSSLAVKLKNHARQTARRLTEQRYCSTQTSFYNRQRVKQKSFLQQQISLSSCSVKILYSIWRKIKNSANRIFYRFR